MEAKNNKFFHKAQAAPLHSLEIEYLSGRYSSSDMIFNFDAEAAPRHFFPLRLWFALAASEAAAEHRDRRPPRRHEGENAGSQRQIGTASTTHDLTLFILLLRPLIMTDP